MESAEVKTAIDCTNCRNEILPGNFQLHELHCVRNIKFCDLCDLPVQKTLFDSHAAESHQTCTTCKLIFPKNSFNGHLFPCEHCGLYVCPQTHQSHVKMCAVALVECHLCKLTVRRNILNASHQTICPKAEVTCESCKVPILREDITRHTDKCIAAKASRRAPSGVMSSSEAGIPTHELGLGHTHSCNYCELSFSSVEYLEIHMCTDHPELL